MEQTMGKNKIILDAVKNIPVIASRESWVVSLDVDDGTLFYAPQVIPSGAKLHQVTDEYAIYLGEENKPSGVVIECFNANFIKHHEPLASMGSGLFVSTGASTKEINPRSSTGARAFAALLENTLINDATDNPVFA